MVVFSWYCWRFRKTTSFYRTAVRVVCLFSFLGVCQNCILLLIYQIWLGTNKEEKACQKNTFSFQVKASFLSRNIDENIQVIYRLSVMLQRRTTRKSNYRHHHHHHFLLLCRWTTSKRQEVIVRPPPPTPRPATATLIRQWEKPETLVIELKLSRLVATKPWQAPGHFWHAGLAIFNLPWN